MNKKAIRLCPVCNKLFWVMVNPEQKKISNHYAKRIYPLQTEVRKKGCICCSTHCSKTFNRVRNYLYKKHQDEQRNLQNKE